MNRSGQTLVEAMAAVALHCVVFPFFMFVAVVAFVAAPVVTGAIGGIAFVFVLTRWINRRDDPRLAKRPPDAP
jgi:uncharacterized YccA/Bax inhibitor family protein